MHVGYSHCLKDAMACKTKWNILIPDYHQILDFYAKVGTNEEWYWNITNCEHVQIRLSKASMKGLYIGIHEWYGSKSQMHPSHVRDLMNLHDWDSDEGDEDDSHHDLGDDAVRGSLILISEAVWEHKTM